MRFVLQLVGSVALGSYAAWWWYGVAFQLGQGRADVAVGVGVWAIILSVLAWVLKPSLSELDELAAPLPGKVAAERKEMRWYSWLNPFTNARQAFKPESAYAVPTGLQQLSDWRAGLGFALIMVLSLSSTPVAVVGVERLFNAYLAAYVTIAVIPLFTGLYWLLHPGMPQEKRRAVKQVWLRLGVFLGTLLLSIPIFWNTGDNGEPPSNPVQLIVGLWLAFFSCMAAYYVLRWTFGIGDITPTLAPAVTSTVAVMTYAIDVLKVDKLQLPDTVTPSFQSAAKLAALLSVLLLAFCEAVAIQREARRRPSASAATNNFGRRP